MFGSKSYFELIFLPIYLDPTNFSSCRILRSCAPPWPPCGCCAPPSPSVLLCVRLLCCAALLCCALPVRSGSGGVEGEKRRGQGLRGGATGGEGGASLGIARWRDAAARGGGGGARGGGNKATHGRRRQIGRAAAVMSQGRGRVTAGGGGPGGRRRT